MIQSLTFWCVLLGATVVHWLIPVRWRMGFIAAVSFGYLATLEPVGVAVLVVWSIAFYLLAPGKEHPRGRAMLLALVLAILGYLAAFKYLPPLLATLTEGFAYSGVLVTLGMSYYTFKLIHYAVERRRGVLPPHGLDDLLCFILLLPIFTAGPIERFDHFMKHRRTQWRLDDMVGGATRIVHGLVKKFVLGDMLIAAWSGGIDVTAFLADLPKADAFDAWRFVVAVFLYAYMDLGGYTDIAIGSSRLLGFGIMENFNWPIVATSINDFWKRWHTTLAGWCQWYVYMPIIGLTRRPTLAVYSAFIVMGMWHAATWHYLCWALHHATGVALVLHFGRWRRQRGWAAVDKAWWWKATGWAATMLFVAVGVGVYPPVHLAGLPIRESFRILAKLVGVDLP